MRGLSGRTATIGPDLSAGSSRPRSVVLLHVRGLVQCSIASRLPPLHKELLHSCHTLPIEHVKMALFHRTASKIEFEFLSLKTDSGVFHYRGQSNPYSIEEGVVQRVAFRFTTLYLRRATCRCLCQVHLLPLSSDI